jgi:hypothetical protein
MSTISRTSLAVAAGLLLAGCSAKGPAFTEVPPSDDRALVYVYRNSSHAMSLDTAVFDFNGQRAFGLNSGGYSYVRLPPGHYEVKQGWGGGVMVLTTPELWSDLTIKLDVKAGETHYIRFATEAYPRSGAAASWEIGETSPERGRQEILAAKFQAQDKKIPDAFKP